jgi:nitroreductase/NAD-dependent dihydropyrimidine dehydrogenase PreA subunit
MEQNSFDLSKCTRCGICIEVCPIRIIEKDPQSGFPSVSGKNQTRCVRCGHCEAICPEAAVTVTHSDLQPAPAIEADGKISSEQFRAYCLRRRSIRIYKSEPVDRTTLSELFDVARYAPSGVNRQPVKWIVAEKPGTVAALTNATIEWIQSAVDQRLPIALQLNFVRLLMAFKNGLDPICRNAPHLIIAHALKEDRMALGDATIALAHLELAAPSFGLGACWAGYLMIAAGQSPKVKELIGIPGPNTGLGALMVGYPKSRYYRIPKRNIASIDWK